jgi:hypothetical protein
MKNDELSFVPNRCIISLDIISLGFCLLFRWWWQIRAMRPASWQSNYSWPRLFGQMQSAYSLLGFLYLDFTKLWFSQISFLSLLNRTIPSPTTLCPKIVTVTLIPRCQVSTSPSFRIYSNKKKRQGGKQENIRFWRRWLNFRISKREARIAWLSMGERDK